MQKKSKIRKFLFSTIHLFLLTALLIIFNYDDPWHNIIIVFFVGCASAWSVKYEIHQAKTGLRDIIGELQLQVMDLKMENSQLVGESIKQARDNLRLLRSQKEAHNSELSMATTFFSKDEYRSGWYVFGCQSRPVKIKTTERPAWPYKEFGSFDEAMTYIGKRNTKGVAIKEVVSGIIKSAEDEITKDYFEELDSTFPGAKSGFAASDVDRYLGSNKEVKDMPIILEGRHAFFVRDKSGKKVWYWKNTGVFTSVVIEEARKGMAMLDKNKLDNRFEKSDSDHTIDPPQYDKNLPLIRGWFVFPVFTKPVQIPELYQPTMGYLYYETYEEARKIINKRKIQKL